MIISSITPAKPPELISVSQKDARKFITNARKSTRYMRYDLGVTVRKMGLLKLNFLNGKEFPVKLVDISSRGVGVIIPAELDFPLKQKIYISVRFRNFREFEIPCTIVRKSVDGDIEVYGIKFDRVSNKFANYLLKTQTKLTFK